MKQLPLKLDYQQKKVIVNRLSENIYSSYMGRYFCYIGIFVENVI